MVWGVWDGKWLFGGLLGWFWGLRWYVGVGWFGMESEWVFGMFGIVSGCLGW